jgi:hypothetical protein
LRCFLARHAEKRQKNAIKRTKGEKRQTTGKRFFSQLFWQKVFDMGFLLPPKSFCGVFELPLLKNAKNRHKKPSKIIIKKKGTYLPHLAAIWQMYAAFSNFFLRRPLV